jgi:hypothetical protein
MRIEELIKGYLQRRTALQKIESEFKARSAPVKAELEKIEAALAKLMAADGVTSAKTTEGTAYISNVASVKVVNWDAALEFIRQHEAWDLLERRINKTALKDIEGPVPGVALDYIQRVNVRRAP